MTDWSLGRQYLVVGAFTTAQGVAGTLVPLLLADGGYTASAIGPLVALLPLAALASRLPAGAAYHPGRARRLQVGAILAAAVASMAYPHVVGSAELVALLRVVTGFAAGLATTINLAAFLEGIPPGAARARAMGAYGGSMAAGFMAGGAVGGLAGELLGYGGAFLLDGGLWLLALPLLAAPPLPGPAPAEAGAGPTLAGTAQSSPRETLRARLGSLREPTLVRVLVVAFMINALHQLTGTYYPLLAREVGLGLAEIGLIRSSYAMVNTVARPTSAAFIARIGAVPASVAGFVVEASLMALAPLATLGRFPALLVLYGASGVGRAIAHTANGVSLAEGSPGGRLGRGGASAVYHAAQDLGNIAGPLLGAALVPLVGLSGLFLVGPLGLLVVLAGLLVALRQGSHRLA